MNAWRRTKLVLTLTACVAFIPGCFSESSNPQVHSGGGTSIEVVGVTGFLKYSPGSPVENATVNLDYTRRIDDTTLVMENTDDTVSNSKGRFNFLISQTGRFQVRSSQAGFVAQRGFFVDHVGDSLFLDTIYMKRPGRWTIPIVTKTPYDTASSGEFYWNITTNLQLNDKRILFRKDYRRDNMNKRVHDITLEHYPDMYRLTMTAYLVRVTDSTTFKTSNYPYQLTRPCV